MCHLYFALAGSTKFYAGEEPDRVSMQATCKIIQTGNLNMKYGASLDFAESRHSIVRLMVTRVSNRPSSCGRV